MQKTSKKARCISLFLVSLIAISISAFSHLPHQVLAVASISTNGGSGKVPVEVGQPGNSDARPSDTLNGRKLIFDDEFNGSSLDQTKWNVRDEASVGNHELEYYTPDDVSVSGGALVLKSEHRSYGGRQYTSGAVDTLGKFSFTYGKVVIRAKMPQGGQGIWPALWLVDNSTGTQPNEIDILEQKNQSNIARMFAHYGPKQGVDLIHYFACSPYSNPDFSASYHVFSVEWGPRGNITWSIDGEQRCHQTIPGYFDKPMHIILNTAVGGDWPGNPDASTPFPQYFFIDYVRVYQ